MEFEGNKLAFIGIGGGSDCIQASIVAGFCPQQSCIISVRRAVTESQNEKGEVGVKRKVENHGGEIFEGVFLITPETRGSGRFFEFVPAQTFPTYLVIYDPKNNHLKEQIQEAINHFGGINSIISVDTGGDSLYRVENESNIPNFRATPDQDLESLQAISEIEGVKKYSLIVAPGTDTPEYAQEILDKANAIHHSFTPEEKEQILNKYRQFHLDEYSDERPNIYSKTALALIEALNGKTGNVRLKLPERLVNDPKNPWNPNVVITDKTAGYYSMDLRSHLAAIGATEQKIEAKHAEENLPSQLDSWSSKIKTEREVIAKNVVSK